MLKFTIFVKNDFKVGFIRKHRNLLALLLIVLFTVSIKQASQVDFNNTAKHSGILLIKTSPFIAGNTSYANLDKAHHSVLFFPVKVIFHLKDTPSLKSVHASILLYLKNKTALSGATPSILGFICKLQI